MNVIRPIVGQWYRGGTNELFEVVAIDDQGGAGHLAWRADPGDDITEVSAGLTPDGTALLGTNGKFEWAAMALRCGRVPASSPIPRRRSQRAGCLRG